MPALRVTTVFGGSEDPAMADWDINFQQLTGIDPASDPNADEGYVDGKWTYTFILYTEDGPYIFPTDAATPAAKQYQEQLRQGGLTPIPKEWAIVPTTKGRRLSPAQTQIIQKEMQEQGATPEQIQETLVKASEAIEGQEVLQPQRTPRVRRLGAKPRPARFRNLSREREWMEYIRPGETVPYWQQMGLHEVPEGEVVDEDTWRIVYRAWYATTPEARLSSQNYNRTKGRRIQSGWEKGINPKTGEFDPEMKGPGTRAKYFKSDKGKAARAASNTRSKIRLKLGRALIAEELSDKEVEWIQTINDPMIGGTGQSWIDVIQNARERYGIEISHDEIETIFWEQGLRPLLKTYEDLQNWIHRDDSGRINPATGEELI